MGFDRLITQKEAGLVFATIETATSVKRNKPTSSNRPFPEFKFGKESLIRTESSVISSVKDLRTGNFRTFLPISNDYSCLIHKSERLNSPLFPP